MINSQRITKDLLNKYGLYAKKSFGQNFLIDDKVLNSISELTDTDKNDLIIEIGPGLGNLTEYLIEKANLLLFEIDERMIDVIKDRFRNKDNFTIINQDVLKVDIDSEILKLEEKNNLKYSSVKVVANLPYYITSPILFMLLENSKRIDEIIVMVQKEVADRITAEPLSKEYGILSVMVDFYANAKKEIIVKPSSFIPMPNVTSAVVKIKKEKKYNDVDINIFKELVHKSFANRRKKMINSLEMNNFMNLGKEEIKNIFRDLSLSENTRAEELPTSKYIEITNYVSKIPKFVP